MSAIVGAVIGASTIYGGIKGSQQAKAYGEGKAAAGQIKQERLGLLGEQRDLSTQAIQSQFTGGQRDLSMEYGTGLGAIQEATDFTRSQSGLVTSGTIEQKSQTQETNLAAKYQSDMQKLFQTRELARSETDLSFREGEITAEQAYQNQLSGMDPGGAGAGAMGGFMGSIGLVASDKRLKENIDYIGDSPSGIKMYEFNYLNNDTRHRGVIANDLVDSHPNAVSKSKDGYYMVDYSQIDVDFEIVKRG